jgi:hypothetical protein
MSPRQRFRLTEGQKAVILDCHNNRQKSTEIAHDINIPSTIISFLRNAIPTNLPHPGRPRKTSKTHDCYIIRKAEANAKIPLAILRDITSNLSISIIRRRLAESIIKNRRAAKRPRLTVKHIKACLKWVKECLERSEEQFGTVI